MELILVWILGCLFGAGTVITCFALMRGNKRMKPPDPVQPEEEMPPRLKKQWDNFWAYDGTGRGQVNIEDE